MPSRVPTYRPRRFGTPGALTAGHHYERRADRQEDKDFYKSPVWRKLRALKLSMNPLCEDCSLRGRTTPAAHVHHVRDRKQHPALALDIENLQALCVGCHNRKRREHVDRG
jgi:5-methylcytosine-specific restriction protein A